MTLPPHESDKILSDQFASFFHNKINTIRDTFIPPGTEKDVHPSSDPLKITAFTGVHQDTVNKTIKLAYEILPVGSLAYISHQRV